MERHTTTSRAEAERLLGIAEKLLRSKDFSGCRDFAILAQETEPLLEGSDQILAVAEVLLASENKRFKGNQHDWYAILQIPQRTDELELVKKQYRRLALLLHPDKNKFPFADSAFRLVADSWGVLSDPAKKSAFDKQFSARFTKVDLVATRKQHQQPQPRTQKKTTTTPPPQCGIGGDNSNQKLPVRRSGKGAGGPSAGGGGASTGGGSAGVGTTAKNGGGNPGLGGNFWTACPYCYNLYEYPRAYEGSCLRCDNRDCKRTFTAAEVRSMPPLVPGKDFYYCCWGVFPMGFTTANGVASNRFPKWMPPIFGGGVAASAMDVTAMPPPEHVAAEAAPNVAEHTAAEAAPNVAKHTAAEMAPNVAPQPAAVPMSEPVKRKRGRPKKYFRN